MANEKIKNEQLTCRIAKKLIGVVDFNSGTRATNISNFHTIYHNVNGNPLVDSIMCDCILPYMLQIMQECIENKEYLVDSINKIIGDMLKDHGVRTIKGSFSNCLMTKYLAAKHLSFDDIFVCVRKCIVDYYYKKFKWPVFQSFEHIRLTLNAYTAHRVVFNYRNAISFRYNRVFNISNGIPSIYNLAKDIPLIAVLQWAKNID